MPKLYRLACSNCDRDDHIRLAKLPEGWQGIIEVETYKRAIRENVEDIGRWWTHIGLCPDCQQHEQRKEVGRELQRLGSIPGQQSLF